MNLNQADLSHLIDSSERAVRDAIVKSNLDDETAAFACLSAMSRYMTRFMAPEVVGGILLMLGADIATQRGGRPRPMLARFN
jgi:hypothetical protein